VLAVAGLVCAVLLGTVTPSPWAAAAAPTAASAIPATVPGAGDVRVDRPVQPEKLEIQPLMGWGVVGYQEQVGVANKSKVWDFAQIGDRLFVAGSFTGVQQNYWGTQTPPPVQEQPFLAAFDVDTNTWISTFRPTFDAPVMALAVGADGKLLVGGAFTTVNGTARGQLAKIDPLTGALETAFTAETANVGTDFPALVRELKIDGDWLYLAGDFNRVVNAPVRHGVYSVARVRWTTGAFDSDWRPRVTGAGVNDVEPDPTRQRVHLAGNFTAVDGLPGTAYQATVSMTDGAATLGVSPFVNDSSQFWEMGVALAGDRLWTAGSEHHVQVLDANTRRRVDYYRTGSLYTGFDMDGQGMFAGGDYQVVEAIDDFVIAGCHCFGVGPTFPEYNQTHYWSGGDSFSGHRFAIAYDPTSGRPLSFIPSLAGGHYGTWAFGSDTNGCLYIGGDYTVGGNGLAIGGYGRFCPPATAPQALAVAVTGARSVALSWRAPVNAGSGLSRYRVLRNGVFVGETTSTSFAVGGLKAGTAYRFTVTAVATDGRLSPAAAVSTTIVADTVAPTAPTGLQLATNATDRVDLSWQPATDNIAVTGYLVHRNYQFLAYVPTGTSFSDTTVAAGSSYVYEVRAQDLAGNVSAPTPAGRIAVRRPDVTAPVAPAAVTATTNGTSSVTLNWSASTDDVGVTGYLVHRDFQFLAYVPAGTTFTDTTVVAGRNVRYEVRAQDEAGNLSPPGPVAAITVVPGGVDITAPAAPTALAAQHRAGTGTVLTWTPATDDVGVTGYLVHRDYRFVAYLPGPAVATFTDPNLAAGATARYQIRAQDAAGNNSAPASLSVTAR